MIFINFKTYEKGSGVNAISLVRILEAVSQESGVKIIPVVQATDIREIVSATTLAVWAQNVDPVEFGAHTGSILPEAVKEDGAEGTFLNHSEHRFKDKQTLAEAVVRSRQAGLKTLVFAANLDELKEVTKFKPTFVSYEPPELVGSKTTSVSEAKPEVVSKAVEITNKQGLPLIIGAGIKSREDIKTGLSLGAAGFAVASAIVAAPDPRSELMALVAGYE